MTYNELLQQKEWWSKCNEILSRDHYTCKDCGCLGYHNGYSYMKLNTILYTKPHPFKNIKFEKDREAEDGGIGKGTFFIVLIIAVVIIFILLATK